MGVGAIALANGTRGTFSNEAAMPLALISGFDRVENWLTAPLRLVPEHNAVLCVALVFVLVELMRCSLSYRIIPASVHPEQHNADTKPTKSGPSTVTRNHHCQVFREPPLCR
jgi:hypothetical protein